MDKDTDNNDWLEEEDEKGDRFRIYTDGARYTWIVLRSQKSKK